MCKLYILCSEQLSQQPHYDYGLRAVKSVLVMAGGLKRANPDISEDLVLIRALRDSNLPKFLADDIPLFFAIIKDLFPGVVVPDNDYGEFQVAMEDEITKAGLQNVPGFHKKVIQMFDIFNIRFGADSEFFWNFNVTWSRRWRLHETAPPRRRRGDGVPARATPPPRRRRAASTPSTRPRESLRVACESRGSFVTVSFPRRRDARGTDRRGQVDLLPHPQSHHDVAPQSRVKK
jgi:hypothetical protein